MRLRRPRAEDVEPFAQINADARFTRYLSPGGAPYTTAQSAAAVRHWIHHWERHGFGLWVVEELESGRVIGRAGTQFHRLWPEDPEVGWGIEPDLWGRGYATEAGSSAIAHAFETLDVARLVSIVHPENGASKRVQERLGLQPWKTVAWPEGGLALEVRALERADWARLQSPS